MTKIIQAPYNEYEYKVKMIIYKNIRMLSFIILLMLTSLFGNAQTSPTIVSKEIYKAKGIYNYYINFTMTPESVPQIDSLRFDWIRFDTKKVLYHFTGQITKTPNSSEYRFDTYFLGPYGIDTYKNAVVYQTDNEDNLNSYVVLSTYFKNGIKKTDTYFLNNVSSITPFDDIVRNFEISNIIDLNGRDVYQNFNSKITGLYIINYKNGRTRKILIE